MGRFPDRGSPVTRFEDSTLNAAPRRELVCILRRSSPGAGVRSICYGNTKAAMIQATTIDFIVKFLTHSAKDYRRKSSQ